MASNTIEIKVKALMEGMDKIKAASADLGDLDKSAKGGAGALGGIKAPVIAAGDGFSQLASSMKTAAVAFAAFLAIKGLKELADYAARSETLGVTLSVVGRNAGYTKDQLAGYEKELRGLGITTQAAREGMTKMMQAGIGLGVAAGQTESTVGRLARASQDLAVVSGMNSSETFNRMITNIQQMDTMGLRFMGLTVNIEGAQEKFAKSIGTTSSALTGQQKIQAVSIAVLDESAKLQGAYAESMETVGKKVQSLKRYQEEFADSMGEKLLPAYGMIVDGATNLLKSLTDQAEAFDQNGTLAKQFADSVGGAVNAISDTISTSFGVFLEYGDLFTSMGGNAAGIVKDFFELATSMIKVADDAGLLQGTLFAIAFGIAVLRDGLRALQMAFLFLGGIALGELGKMLNALGLILQVVTLGAMGDGIRDMGTAFKEAGAGSRKLAEDIYTDFENNNSAVGRLANGVNEATISLSSFGKASNFKTMEKEVENLSTFMAQYSTTSIQSAQASQAVIDKIKVLAKEGKLTKEQVKELITTMADGGVQMEDGLLKGEVAMKALEKSTAQTQVSMSDFGKGNSLAAVKEEMQKLIAAQRDGVLSSDQLSRAAKLVAGDLDALAKVGGLSAKDLSTLNKQVGAVAVAVSEDYAKAMKEMGTTSEELASGVDDKFSKVVGSLVQMGTNANATGLSFSQAFNKEVNTAKSVASLGEITNALDAVNKRAISLFAVEDMDKQSELLYGVELAAAALRSQFAEVFSGDLKAATTVDEVMKISAGFEKVALQAGFSADQIEDAGNRIRERMLEVATTANSPAMVQGLKAIGTSYHELTTGASESGDKMSAAFKNIAADGKLTASQLYAAFSKGIVNIKTLEDLGLAKNGLEDMHKSGQITGDALKAANEKLAGSFNKVFQDSLKAASTSEDFKKLNEEVMALGKAGVLSGAQVAASLDKIKEKASGAGEAAARAAKQATEAAQGDVSVANARLSVATNLVNVTKAESDVMAAQAAYARDGTEAKKMALDVAQAKLLVAKAEVEQARAQLALEREVAAEKRAQANVVNTGKALEKDPTNGSLVSAAAMAEKQAAAQSLVTEAARETALQQAENTINAKEGVAALEAQAAAANSVKDAVETTGEVSKSSGDAVVKLGSQAREGSNWATQMYESIGLSAEEAKKLAPNLADGTMMTLDLWGRTVNGVLEGVSKIKDAIDADHKAADEFTKKLGEAKREADILRNGGAGAGSTWDENIHGVSKYKEALFAAQQAASALVKSSADSAQGFIKGAGSIHVELLQAQGREKEAAAARRAQRLSDLELEQQMLTIKLQAAKIEAQAAGVSTAAIDKALSQVSSAFGSAKRDIAALGAIEDAAIDKKKKDEAKAAADAKVKEREEARARARALADEAAAERGKPAEAIKTARESLDTRSRTASFDTKREQVDTRVSESARSASGEGEANRVSKVIKVDFALGRNAVSANIAERDEFAMLALLESIQRRS